MTSVDKISSLGTRLIIVFSVMVCIVACGKERDAEPVLLDSAENSSTGNPELDRLRKVQAIRMEAKPRGCVSSLRPGDSERFPDPVYYFAEPVEGECPAGCTPDGDTCRAPSGECDAECLPSEWLQIETNLFELGGPDGSLVSGMCELQGMTLGNCFDSAGAEDCEERVCGSLGYLCRANVALELSAVRTRPLEVTIPSSSGAVDFRVPSQSTATNAALAEYGAYAAHESFKNAMWGLHSGLDLLAAPTEICSPDTLKKPIDGNLEFVTKFAAEDPSDPAQTPGEVFSRVAVDAYRVYHEAIQRAVQLNIAFADSQRSNPNIEVSVQRQQTAPVLSRSWASHLLVGGTVGLSEALLTTGLCTVPEPSDGAQACLGLFREAGVCPADVVTRKPAALDNGATLEQGRFVISTRDLLEAPSVYDVPPTTDQPSAGSLCFRLYQKHGVECDVETLYRDHGVTIDDCEEARAILEQEHRAFARHPTWVYPTNGTDSDGYPMLPDFASTKNPPRTPEPMLYAGLARNDETVRVSGGGDR